MHLTDVVFVPMQFSCKLKPKKSIFPYPILHLLGLSDRFPLLTLWKKSCKICICFVQSYVCCYRPGSSLCPDSPNDTLVYAWAILRFFALYVRHVVYRWCEMCRIVHPKFAPSVLGLRRGPQNWKIWRNFGIKMPHRGPIPYAIFYEILNVCGQFLRLLTTWIWGFAPGIPELWSWTLECISP